MRVWTENFWQQNDAAFAHQKCALTICAPDLRSFVLNNDFENQMRDFEPNCRFLCKVSLDFFLRAGGDFSPARDPQGVVDKQRGLQRDLASVSVQRDNLFGYL